MLTRASVCSLARTFSLSLSLSLTRVRQSLISFSWKRKPRTLYSVHILKHDRLQRAAIMYYAFAIVKRVRAPPCVLSSAKWTPGSHACSYVRVYIRVRPRALYIRRHAFTFSAEQKEEKKEKRRLDDAVNVAFPVLFHPLRLLSCRSFPFSRFLLLGFPVSRTAREFGQLEFEERGNAPGEKRRCTREVSGFTGTRTEFAGLSRLIR